MNQLWHSLPLVVWFELGSWTRDQQRNSKELWHVSLYSLLFYSLGGIVIPKHIGASSVVIVRNKFVSVPIAEALCILWSTRLQKCQMRTIRRSNVPVSCRYKWSFLDCHRIINLHYCSACGTRYARDRVDIRMDNPQDNVLNWFPAYLIGYYSLQGWWTLYPLQTSQVE